MENKDYKNYFLGLMSAENLETLELQIMSGDETEAELIRAENDLIEDYLDKNLTIAETQAFNTNFLITQERRERVKFVVLMNSYIEKASTQSEIKSSFFDRLKAFFSLNPITLVFASISLLLMIGIAWQIIFDSGKDGSKTEIAALNEQDLSNLEEFKNYKNLSLGSGSLRSGGSFNNLLRKDLTERILLRLALPNSDSENSEWRINLFRNEKVLQTFVQRSLKNQEIRLLLPKSLLEKGEYQISLEKDGEKYNYFFAVE